MANQQIGTAYLMVVPQLKGDFSKDLKQGITAGANGAGKAAGQQAGDGISVGLSAKAVAIGNVISNAITAGAKAGADALAEIVQQAFEGFSTYEQLSGGVEKIFGEDAARVLADAQQAFATAGLSANQYMENVTGFSSALISSLGGDTDAAARIANMALIDMSDNVNTFGSNMESVAHAYQGFARGSYVMLDNLKLGYGGSASEAERLLRDAEAITGIHYDLSNLADVYEAIHVIQTQMNITGKTAEEALTTVEGSVASLNAAWQNWLTELGKPNADMSEVTDALISALEAAAANVIPALQRIVARFVSEFPSVIAGAASALLGDSAQPVIDAFSQVGEFAMQVADFVGQAWEQLAPLMQPLFDLLAQIADVMANQIIPLIIEIAGSEIVAFIGSVIVGIGGILAGIGQLVSFVSSAVSQIAGFFDGLYSGLVTTFENLRTNVEGIINGLVEFFAGIPGQIVGFFSGIASDIGAAFSNIKLPGLHFEGSLNPADWLTTGKLPSISFYASGGIVNSPHLGVFGEAGPEAIVPLSPQKLQPFGDAVAQAMGGAGGTSVYIDGARVNDNAAVEELFYSFMQELARLGYMNGGARVGYAV